MVSQKAAHELLAPKVESLHRILAQLLPPRRPAYRPK
jgi:hypothetical protein